MMQGVESGDVSEAGRAKGNHPQRGTDIFDKDPLLHRVTLGGGDRATARLKGRDGVSGAGESQTGPAQPHPHIQQRVALAQQGMRR